MKFIRRLLKSKKRKIDQVKMVLKIGLIGLGDVSRYHLDAIKRNPQFSLVAVCDTDSYKRTNSEIDGVQFFEDYRRMLSDVELDAVTVATPHNSHAQITIDALESGRHVLVEKPMATRLEDAIKMSNTADKNGRTLVVSYHFRFVPEVQYLKDNIDQFGAIKSFDVYFTGQTMPQTPWRLRHADSGGVWIDNGANVISVLSYFIPDMKLDSARFEYGSRVKISDPQVEDYAEVVLSSDSVKGHIIVDWRAKDKPHYTTKLETGSGQVLLGHFDHTVVHNGRLLFHDNKDERYHGVFRDFIRRVEQGNGNAKEAIKDLEIVLNAHNLATSLKT